MGRPEVVPPAENSPLPHQFATLEANLYRFASLNELPEVRENPVGKTDRLRQPVFLLKRVFDGAKLNEFPPGDPASDPGPEYGGYNGIIATI